MTKKIIALVIILGAFVSNVFAQNGGVDLVLVPDNTEEVTTLDGLGNDAFEGLNDPDNSEEVTNRNSNKDFRVSVNGGVDLVLVPLQVVMRDTVEYEDNIWFGSGIGGNGAFQGIRTRVNLSANHEDKFGFRTDIWFLYTNNGANIWSQEPGQNPNSPNSPNNNIFEVRLGDYGEVWWKPTDWFQLEVGRVYNGAQRGRIENHWLSAWSIGMFDGNNIFSSHYSGNIGFLAQYAPPQVDGFSVSVFVPQFGMAFTEAQLEYSWPSGTLLVNGGDRLNDPDNSEEVTNRNSNRAFRVFERTWVTIGYRNENINARLQYIGANSNGYRNWMGDDVVEPYAYRIGVTAPRIEAAFAYLTENFAVDLGVKSWLPISDWITDTWNNDIDNGSYLRLSNTGTYWGGIGFGLGVAYTNEQLNEVLGGELAFYFRADGDLLRSWQGNHEGVDTTITNPLRLSFHFWPSFTFPNGLSITLHGGFNYIGRNTVDIGGANPNKDSTDWDNSERLRFGGGLSFDMVLFGASSVSIGLAYSHGTGEARGGEPRTISLPVYFFYHW